MACVIKLKMLVRLLRPKNWVKNVFVFLPLVFARSVTDVGKLTFTFAAFFSFCLASSAIYIFNDIRDAEADRAHPVKQKRPIASREIGVAPAAVFAAVLSAAALGLMVRADLYAAAAVLVYMAENLLYTVKLKHKPVYDCFCIALGFVLRVYAGSFVCGEPVSDWLFLTVTAMSLFMAFGKRRGEMLRVDKKNRRAVLRHYDLFFLEGMVFVCAGLSVAFYALWAMARGMNMIYTVPLIIFIICRYLLTIRASDSHGDPTTVILSDKTLISACLLYVAAVFFLLYR